MANIDAELVFLRDAKEGEGNIAREAIVDALTEISNDVAYPYKKIKITEDGEYETDDEHPFTNVEIDVPDMPTLVDGFADRFKVTENKEYKAYDLFPGKDMVITEFDVEVPQILRKKKSITINQNGEYEAGQEECYNQIMVDISNSHHEGDLLEPSFYYSTPGNPNFDSNQYIFTDHGILFGTRAGLIFRRLPKLDDVNYNGKTYIQDSWNPGIDAYNGLTTDQQFVPTWNIPPNGYSRPNPKIVYFDADVFTAVCYNKAIKWFLKPGETVIINGSQAKFRYIADSYAGIEKTFWEWSNVDELMNLHYASNDSLLNTRDVINSDNDYYCWKHSLVRAVLNNSSADLSAQADKNAYSSFEDIKNILGSELFNTIYSVTHYVNYAKRRDPNSKFYRYKTYRFWENEYNSRTFDNYYLVEHEDIPDDNPKAAGLYECTSYKAFKLTEDETTDSNKYYYRKTSISSEKGIAFLPVSYNNYTGEYDNIKRGELTYEIGFSKNKKRSIAAYIDNGRSYRFNLQNGVIVKTTEYTFLNHLNFIVQHYSNWKKETFDNFKFSIYVTFGRFDSSHYFSPMEEDYGENVDPSLIVGLYDITKLPDKTPEAISFFERKDFTTDSFDFINEYEQYRVTDTEWDNEFNLDGHLYTKYRYMLIEINHWAETDLNNRFYNYTKEFRGSGSKSYQDKTYEIWSKSDIFQESLWRSKILTAMYPGYKFRGLSSLYLYDEYSIRSQSSKQSGNVLRYNYTEPVSFMQRTFGTPFSEETDYPHLKGIDIDTAQLYDSVVSNLFDNVNVYRDPHHPYHFYEKINIVATNVFDLRYYVISEVYATTPSDRITNPYLMYVSTYIGNDAVTLWNSLFDGYNPEDYKESTYYLNPKTGIFSEFYTYEQMYPDPDDQSSTEYYYYFFEDEMNHYDNPGPLSSRRYYIYKAKRYKYINLDHGERYLYIFVERFRHEEERSSSSSSWSVKYDDGAKALYDSIKNLTKTDYVYIWGANSGEKEFESKTIEENYTAKKLFYLPYIRVKDTNHGYIEDGDVYSDEPYYRQINSPMIIANPFKTDEYSEYADGNYYSINDIQTNNTGRYSLYTIDSSIFYDIVELMGYYGEYNLYYYSLDDMNYDNKPLYKATPRNDIYYAEEDSIFVVNDVENSCDICHDKFLLSTDIWLDEGCLYPDYGRGFSEDEIVLKSEPEYSQKKFLYEFLDIESEPFKPKAINNLNVVSQHTYANAAYRYSAKEDYLHGHYPEAVDDFFNSKSPEDPQDHWYPTENDAQQIMSDLGDYYDTVITQKKYELQGSFDATTGSSQIKHAYFFI
jgi:hypothetical protein